MNASAIREKVEERFVPLPWWELKHTVQTLENDSNFRFAGKPLLTKGLNVYPELEDGVCCFIRLRHTSKWEFTAFSNTGSPQTGQSTAIGGRERKKGEGRERQCREEGWRERKRRGKEKVREGRKRKGREREEGGKKGEREGRREGCREGGKKGRREGRRKEEDGREEGRAENILPLVVAGEGEAPPTSSPPRHLVGVLNRLDDGDGASRAPIPPWLTRNGVLEMPQTIGEENAPLGAEAGGCLLAGKEFLLLWVGVLGQTLSSSLFLPAFSFPSRVVSDTTLIGRHDSSSPNTVSLSKSIWGGGLGTRWGLPAASSREASLLIVMEGTPLTAMEVALVVLTEVILLAVMEISLLTVIIPAGVSACKLASLGQLPGSFLDTGSLEPRSRCLPFFVVPSSVTKARKSCL